MAAVAVVKVHQCDYPGCHRQDVTQWRMGRVNRRSKVRELCPEHEAPLLAIYESSPEREARLNVLTEEQWKQIQQKAHRGDRKP